jgi:hypothetical protein
MINRHWFGKRCVGSNTMHGRSIRSIDLDQTFMCTLTLTVLCPALERAPVLNGPDRTSDGREVIRT